MIKVPGIPLCIKGPVGTRLFRIAYNVEPCRGLMRSALWCSYGHQWRALAGPSGSITS
jgi:hypothetical protein